MCASAGGTDPQEASPRVVNCLRVNCKKSDIPSDMEGLLGVTVKLSDYVINFLADHGVAHVFFIPGGAAMHLNDSLGKADRIKYVCNLHEQASAICAEAYGKITNNLGVAMVTAGPGGTNTITGVAGAWLDSTPMMVISGQVKRPDLKGDRKVRMLGVQEIDIVTMVSSITKYAVTILDPSTIRFHLEKAFHLATSGRKGPVWIDIPLDVQAALIEPDQLAGFEPKPPTQPSGLSTQVNQVLENLTAAQRPVLLVGNGVRLAGAVPELHEFLRRVKIPVLTSWLGMDLIADDHPYFMGRPGSLAPRGANFTLQNSDFLLVVGSRLDMAMTAYAHAHFAPEALKVMVDVDAAEIDKMQTPIALRVCADAHDFLREVLRQLPTVPACAWPSWIRRCREWKARYPLVLPEHRDPTKPISMYLFSEVLSEEAGEDDIFAPGSSGFAAEIFLLVVKTKSGQRIFHNRGTGSMGLGLPAAIGACVASGGRRTICVDGDGGFQMNVQELASVAALKLPTKIFIINNGGFASIRASQSVYFKRLVGADPTSGLTLPEVTKVAAAYGITTTRIDQLARLRDGIREALRSPGPMVVEVLVAANEERIPRIISTQRSDGTMVSKPLEDLYPFLDRDEFLANMLIPPATE